MSETLITVSSEDNGQRLERWLKRNAPHIPYALLQKLLRKGAIRIDGKKAKPAALLQAGQQVRIPAVESRGHLPVKPPKPTREQAEHYLLSNILYQDDRLIAINKPAGLAAQGGSGVKISVDDMLDYLKGPADTQRPRLVHRIDKDTSGIMILAKGDRINATYLTNLFRDKQVEKVYWAIVVGTPKILEGDIKLPLTSKKQQGAIEKTMVDEETGKRAVTRYRVMDHAASKLSWVELYPLTGRMHQLRAHMQAIGHPIMGDGKYGGKEAFIHGLSNLMHLHARQITIPNYKGKKALTITAPLSQHMRDTFAIFGFREK